MTKPAKNHDIKLGRDDLQAKLSNAVAWLNRYKLITSVVIVAIIYGFFVWRINTLNSSQPSSDAVTAQANPLTSAHVDKQTVQQLEALRDNSVNVQALFDQERSNPFQ